MKIPARGLLLLGELRALRRSGGAANAAPQARSERGVHAASPCERRSAFGPARHAGRRKRHECRAPFALAPATRAGSVTDHSGTHASVLPNALRRCQAAAARLQNAMRSTRFPLATALLTLLVGGFPAGTFADDWPQWLGPQRDGVWRETGIVEEFPVGGPKIRWRTPVRPGFSGPVVAGGRVFVTDRKLDPGARVNEDDPFDRSVVAGTERVLCLDEKNGQVLWSHEYPAAYGVSYNSGPRASPVVRDGKIYTLGTEGHLLCLDTKTGGVLWSRACKKDFGVKTPLWGFAAHPLLDGDRLICLVGGKGSVVVAFHKDTGRNSGAPSPRAIPAIARPSSSRLPAAASSSSGIPRRSARSIPRAAACSGASRNPSAKMSPSPCRVSLAICCS